MPFAVINTLDNPCRAIAILDTAQLPEAVVIRTFENESLDTQHADSMPAVCDMPQAEGRGMPAVKNLLVDFPRMHNTPALDISLAFPNLEKKSVLMPEFRNSFPYPFFLYSSKSIP